MVEPLAAATTVSEIEDYPWPDMDDPTRIAHVAEQAARLAEDEFAVIATPWLLFPWNGPSPCREWRHSS